MKVGIRSRFRVFRFVVAGAFNTGATYVFYLILIQFANYNFAYAVSYLIGIALSYWLNLKFVFKQGGSVRKLATYPVVYVAQYLIGALTLNILVENLGIPIIYGPAITIVATLPMTYILTKLILMQGANI